MSLLEHLGDIVACEPVARFLRQEYPDAYIVWMVKKEYRELIDSNPLVDKTVVVHCLSERMMLWGSGVFDRVIDLHFQDRYCTLCRRPLRKRDGNASITLKNYFAHDGLLSAMTQSAGLPALEEGPKVYIPKDAALRVDGFLLPGRFIVINCSSNNEEKDLPAVKWMDLIEQIATRYSLPVVEVGISSALSGYCHQKYINLCGRLTILEAAEVIRRALLFVGIDSGPAHLANAVGTFGVVAMGSYLGFARYNPFSGPYKSGMNAEIVFQQGRVADISVERLFDAVGRRVDIARNGTVHAV